MRARGARLRHAARRDDVRGLRELLTDGRDALLVPAGEPEALAAALRRVLDDEELADQARRQAGAELARRDTEDAHGRRVTWPLRAAGRA